MYDMDMSNQGNRPFVASKTPRKTDNGESTILLCYSTSDLHIIVYYTENISYFRYNPDVIG